MGSMPKNSRVQQQQQQHARSSQKQAARQQQQQTKRRLARTILPATQLIIFFILTPGTKHHGLLHHGPLRNQPGRGSWSFGGRTWKPRASDHFAARPWGIEMMEVEAGAAIYRNKRAEGTPYHAPYARPPTPHGGRGLPHPLRGVGAGTDRPRAGPQQLAARAYGLMSSSIADWGQCGRREAQNTQD